MFLGEYSHSLDAKGRIAVPAKFRSELGDTVVISRYLDGCLAIYSQSGWDRELEKLMQLDSNKKDVRRYIDYMTSKAFELTLDSQGRINVPAPLIKSANLQKDCVFTGSIDKIKLWDKQVWEAYDAGLTDEEITNIAEGI